MSKKFGALVITTALFGSAQAALLNRGGGLIYDDVANVTWLADAAAMTANRPRLPTFWDAWYWAEDFTFYDGLRDKMLVGWRLSMTNELGSLWEQGVRGGSAQVSFPFVNLAAGPYWGWFADQNGRPATYNFDFQLGVASPLSETYNIYAMPVLPGDVGTPPIPEPASFALLLVGLGVLGFASRGRNSINAASGA